MGYEFEGPDRAELDATPEQIWQAIATGPGIDSWFMGRNQVVPGEHGTVTMDFGEYAPVHQITAWEPLKRFAYRTDTDSDGRFIAYEFLIEGRGQGSTVLRMVARGRPGAVRSRGTAGGRRRRLLRQLTDAGHPYPRCPVPVRAGAARSDARDAPPVLRRGPRHDRAGLVGLAGTGVRLTRRAPARPPERIRTMTQTTVTRTTVRNLLACGAIGAPVFVIAGLIQAYTRKGFDLKVHPFSFLSLGDLGWIQITTFVLTGLMFIAGAVGMRRVLRTGPGRTAGPILY